MSFFLCLFFVSSFFSPNIYYFYYFFFPNHIFSIMIRLFLNLKYNFTSLFFSAIANSVSKTKYVLLDFKTFCVQFYFAVWSNFHRFNTFWMNWKLKQKKLLKKIVEVKATFPKPFRFLLYHQLQVSSMCITAADRWRTNTPDTFYLFFFFFLINIFSCFV